TSFPGIWRVNSEGGSSRSRDFSFIVSLLLLLAFATLGRGAFGVWTRKNQVLCDHDVEAVAGTNDECRLAVEATAHDLGRDLPEVLAERGAGDVGRREAGACAAALYTALAELHTGCDRGEKNGAAEERREMVVDLIGKARVASGVRTGH